MTEHKINLRSYDLSIGDDETLRLWNQRKDIQDISDDSSLSYTVLNEEILQRNSLLMIEFEGDTVGCVGMICDDKKNSITLGIIIAEPEHRKRGLGSIALQLALQQILKETTITKVHAYVYHDNLPAVRLFEKHNFKIAARILFKKKSTFHYILQLR
ncbi:MAG: GNAT family N-acetyltransferase [Flavobacteriales bacterium]